jgi:hypothetical protein
LCISISDPTLHMLGCRQALCNADGELDLESFERLIRYQLQVKPAVNTKKNAGDAIVSYSVF